jgi:hypothetical protein
MATAIDLSALNAIDRELGRIAREGVNGIERDPVSSLVRFRLLGERLSDVCGEAGGLPRNPGEDQYDFLKRLERKGTLNRNLLSRFHKLRLEGNIAVHEGEGDEAGARGCAEAVVYISEWLAAEMAKAAKTSPYVTPPPMAATVTSPLRLVLVLGALVASVMVPLTGHDARAVLLGEAPLPDMARMMWGGAQFLLVLFFAFWLFSGKGRGAGRRVVAAIGIAIGPGIGLAAVHGLLGSATSMPDWMWMAATLVSQCCLLVGLKKSWEISQRPPEKPARQAKPEHPGTKTLKQPLPAKGSALNVVVGEGGKSKAPIAAPSPAVISKAAPVVKPAPAQVVQPTGRPAAAPVGKAPTPVASTVPAPKPGVATTGTPAPKPGATTPAATPAPKPTTGAASSIPAPRPAATAPGGKPGERGSTWRA